MHLPAVILSPRLLLPRFLGTWPAALLNSARINGVRTTDPAQPVNFVQRSPKRMDAPSFAFLLAKGGIARNFMSRAALRVTARNYCNHASCRSKILPQTLPIISANSLHLS